MTRDWTEADYQSVARLLNDHSGILLPPARRDFVEARIRDAMERVGSSSFAKYRALLMRRTRALDDLTEELTVGETYMFREPQQFEALRREIVPSLVRQRGPGHLMRLWSAGCASGEEPYSLAILIHQMGLADRTSILGTDLSRRALAKAARGEYGDWSLRQLDWRQLRPYLRQANKQYRIKPEIRKRVTFRQHNLATDHYPAGATGTHSLDLILCRNVMIYFDERTVEVVAQRFYNYLAIGGWLLTGPSDPPLERYAPFETILVQGGIAYRRSPMRCSGSTRAPGQSSDFENTEAQSAMTATASQPLASSQAVSNVVRHSPPALVSRNEMQRDAVERAAEAFATGDYHSVTILAALLRKTPRGCSLLVRALANSGDTAGAEQVANAAAHRHRLCAELHYLHSVMLISLGRDTEAKQAINKTLYLDSTLAIAHFVHGSLLAVRGPHEDAYRAFRTAHELCASLPTNTLVELSEGETAGQLAAAALEQMFLLDGYRNHDSAARVIHTPQNT